MRAALIILLLTGLAGSRPRAQEAGCARLKWLGFSDRASSFFRPLLADIRAPVFNARYMKAYPDPHTVTNSRGKDNYADISFGGDFLLFGKQCAGMEVTDASKLNAAQLQALKNPVFKAGWGVMLDASMHSLLDYNTASTNLINSDFRVGLVTKWRPANQYNHWSYRFTIFHESTHLGDEFVIDALHKPGFARYNVSHEAVEAMASHDSMNPFKFISWPMRYRIYGGFRYYLSPESFRDYETAKPELQGRRLEQQAGLELFVKLGHSCPLCGYFDQVIFAVDAQHRSRYAVGRPYDSLSVNAVLGLLAGDYLGNGRSIRYYLNYYDGVNPHGQFRMYHTNYLGFNLGLNF